MASSQGLEGTMRALRISRRVGSRRTLVGLISGAALSLLVLALTPHPVPTPRAQTLGHRRIHQEEEDYTAPKNAGALLPTEGESSSAKQQSLGDVPNSHAMSAVLQLGKEAGGYNVQPLLSKPYVVPSKDKQYLLQLGKEAGGYNVQPLLSKPYVVPSKDKQEEDTGFGQVEEVLKKGQLKHNQINKSLPNLNLSQADALSQVVDIPRRTKKRNERVAKAQETELILALQHGFKLTKGQEKLIARMSLQEKEAFITRFSKVVDIPRHTKNGNELVAKAQETALTALQHGFKLTEGQKKLIDRMSPQERKELETRVSKVRAMQEKAYLKQLRVKKQVKPRMDGGEEIISTPQMPVRFPGTLKKVHPRHWLPQYKIFLNITHFPWAKSSSCSNYSTTFKAVDSLPTRALASFPSSGNTWIRYLIEGASGILTGSLYDDSSLTKKGMYGEGIVYDSGMTILQKSHGYTVGDYMKFTHAERLSKNHIDELCHQGVVVIRNPFKALISHRHLDTGGHTGYAPRNHFIGKGWDEFVTLKIMLWKDFYIDWLTLSEPHNIHITHYENVKRDLIKEMEKIIEYLKLPNDKSRLQCVGQNSDGLFKRKPSKNVPLDFNPFTRKLKDLVYEAVDELNRVLTEKGKECLPINMYEFYDNHEAEVARYIRKDRKGES